jgi:hypothetical protein
MARAHEVTDIREVCDALVAELGERALTRDNVQERLKERAEQRGKGRVGADHQLVYNVIRACKADLEAARQQKREDPPAGGPDVTLPEGLSAVLARHVQDVEGLVGRALAETLRQAAQSAQAQVKQIEAAGAALSADLRAQLQLAHEEGEQTAAELDVLEHALATARGQIAELTSLAAARGAALQSLETDTRCQLAAAQSSVQDAFDARVRADEASHTSELARVAAEGELEQARQTLSRLEEDLERCSAAGEAAGLRARDAESARDVANATLAAIKEERDSLRGQLQRALNSKAAESAPRPRKRRGSANDPAGVSP